VLVLVSIVYLLGPLVVLDLLLHLLRELREPVTKLLHRGVLRDTDLLEIAQLALQLLQVLLGQVHDGLGNGGLNF
jgi:hypothetical protein